MSESSPTEVTAAGNHAVVDADPAFIRLIYSFALDGDRAATADVFRHVKRTAHRRGWRDRKILSEFVLPHLANYLNASSTPTDDDSVDRVDDGIDTELGHWWERREPIPTRWNLSIRKDRSVELEVNKIEFLLFQSTGIGMLIFDVDVLSDRLEDWQDALHHMRLYRLPSPEDGEPDARDQARRGVFARRARRIEPLNGERDRFDTRGKSFGFGLLIAGLLDELVPDRQWENASVPGLLLPYSAFFVRWGEGCTERDQFEALYRWRRQLTSIAPVHAVDHDDLNAWLKPYGTGMWLSYSVDGGGFFGADLPDHDFFTSTMPDHLRRPYGFGFLLALHQRLALSRFSEQIGRVVADTPRGALPSRELIAELQDGFLEFLTRSRFVQVLRTTNHHANYQEWERAFQVKDFSDEVELELRSLFERAVVQEQISSDSRADRVGRRVNMVGLGFAFPAVITGMLAIAYPEGLPLAQTALVTAGATVAGLTIGWGLAQRSRD